MARTSYSTEQKDIERQIAKLRKRAEALQEKKRAPAIAQIVRTMNEYGITPTDIAAAFAKKTRTRSATVKTTRATAAKKPASPPKYKDPVSGKTWTGHGKPPRWIVAADQAGTGREQFLIAKA